MAKSITATEVTEAVETVKNEMVGKRVLSNAGDAVIITGEGKCRKVYTSMDEASKTTIVSLSKQSLSINNKLLLQTLKEAFEEVSFKKGWITVKGFRLRYAPAGFEMYDVENHMTPIDLGEAPSIEEISKFIQKPSIKKLTENRKDKSADKRKGGAAPKVEKEAAPVLTIEEQRAVGLKLLQKAARKDVRFVAELKAELCGAVENKKYRIQVGKMYNHYSSFRPATQKKNYSKFVTELRSHLKEFDFTPAKPRAPKFTGLEELDYKGGIHTVSTTENQVEYRNGKGARVKMDLVTFLAHDILYNWSDYNVAMMKVARGEKTVAEIVAANEFVMKDPFCEFVKADLHKNTEALLELMNEIYLWEEEPSPLQYVFNPELKRGSKIRVFELDNNRAFFVDVVQNNPVKIRYEDGGVGFLLSHQNFKLIK